MEAETGVTQPQPRNAWSHQRLEEEAKKLSCRALGGSMALPDFGPLASRTMRQFLSHF